MEKRNEHLCCGKQMCPNEATDASIVTSWGVWQKEKAKAQNLKDFQTNQPLPYQAYIHCVYFRINLTKVTGAFLGPV